MQQPPCTKPEKSQCQVLAASNAGETAKWLHKSISVNMLRCNAESSVIGHGEDVLGAGALARDKEGRMHSGHHFLFAGCNRVDFCSVSSMPETASQGKGGGWAALIF